MAVGLTIPLTAADYILLCYNEAALPLFITSISLRVTLTGAILNDGKFKCCEMQRR